MSSKHTIVTDPDPVFGKMTWDSVPWHDPIIMSVFAVAALGAVALLGFVTLKGWWGYLWREWLTSVDHKKIGIMYILLSLVMLVRGFADALMMRAQQAMSLSDTFGSGYLPPEHFDQVFTAHGVIMIFFVATPLMIGIMNIVIPLQIGARDVAFPFLNSLGFWLAFSGAMLVNISFFMGEFAATGWLNYVPLSGIEYNPWVGVDYWIWSLQISGVGTTITAVNFVATIIKMRAPGMTLMKMPAFTWTTLIANVLGVVIFPILTIAIALLTFDRYADTHFFTNAMGGNQMMWVNLVWAWGHPEVYFLVLPAFGMISEVVATFSKKRLFGYASLVWATVVIGILSFLVWLHHFFTMGAGSSVNAFFGIMTMIIAIPTGVKLYNWIFTMYKGRVELSASMWWVVAFLITFAIGGMTGVMLSIPANDFVLHNSTFLVAHFHNTIIGGAVFGYFAGFTYWFPKATGYKLNETLGKWSVAFWVVGFFIAWIPMYMTGFDGMTRRLNYVDNPDWIPYLQIASVGALIIGLGVVTIVVNLIWSTIKRNDPAYRDITGDPWDGRTLEWATASPPAFYNFADVPEVTDRDPHYIAKRNDSAYKKPDAYKEIHMPTNSWAGVMIGLISIVFGFAFVWHVWWLVYVSIAGMAVCWLGHIFNRNKDYYVPVDTVQKTEDGWLSDVQKNGKESCYKSLGAKSA